MMETDDDHPKYPAIEHSRCNFIYREYIPLILLVKSKYHWDIVLQTVFYSKILGFKPC